MSPIQPVSDQKKGLKIRGYQQPSGDETLKRDGDEEGTSRLRLHAEPALSFVDEGVKSIEVEHTSSKNVMNIQEISQKLVQVSHCLLCFYLAHWESRLIKDCPQFVKCFGSVGRGNKKALGTGH